MNYNLASVVMIPKLAQTEDERNIIEHLDHLDNEVFQAMCNCKDSISDALTPKALSLAAKRAILQLPDSMEWECISDVTLCFQP